MLAGREAARSEAVAVGVFGFPDGAAPAREIGGRHPEVAAVVVLLRGGAAYVEAAGQHHAVFGEVVGLAGQQARLHGSIGGERPAGPVVALVLHRRRLAQRAQVVAGRVPATGELCQWGAAAEQGVRRRPLIEAATSDGLQPGVKAARGLPEQEVRVEGRCLDVLLGQAAWLRRAMCQRRRRSEQHEQYHAREGCSRPEGPPAALVLTHATFLLAEVLGSRQGGPRCHPTPFGSQLPIMVRDPLVPCCSRSHSHRTSIVVTGDLAPPLRT